MVLEVGVKIFRMRRIIQHRGQRADQFAAGREDEGIGLPSSSPLRRERSSAQPPIFFGIETQLDADFNPAMGKAALRLWPICGSKARGSSRPF